VNGESFTIIIPSFNQAEFIGRTLQSVLNQQVDAPVEILVMDGGSTDGTVDILKKYENSIRWVSEPDGGQSDALNKGFARASGTLVGWLNSDDLYLPGTLQTVLEHFNRHPACRWLFGRCRIIDTQEREIRHFITHYKNLLAFVPGFRYLAVENFISQPAVFFRKELLDQAGPVDTNLRYTMDYDLWLRLGGISPPCRIGRYLSAFRVHHESKGARSFTDQFREEYMVHQRYDQNRFRLFLHRLNILKITSGYRMMALLRNHKAQ